MCRRHLIIPHGDKITPNLLILLFSLNPNLTFNKESMNQNSTITKKKRQIWMVHSSTKRFISKKFTFPFVVYYLPSSPIGQVMELTTNWTSNSVQLISCCFWILFLNLPIYSNWLSRIHNLSVFNDSLLNYSLKTLISYCFFFNSLCHETHLFPYLLGIFISFKIDLQFNRYWNTRTIEHSICFNHYFWYFIDRLCRIQSLIIVLSLEYKKSTKFFFSYLLASYNVESSYKIH